MEVCIYSVKARSQVVNMSQIYNYNTKRPNPKENQLRILSISAGEFTHFAGNSAEGFGSRIECCWDYIPIYENKPTGGNTEFFWGGSSRKKCNHECDQSLIKSNWGSV